MAGFSPYYTQLLQQNPSLAQNPAFLSAIQNGGGATTGIAYPNQNPDAIASGNGAAYSTNNNPTNTDPTTVTGTAAQLGSTAPAPIQDFGGIAQVTPTYANAATVNPQQSQQYLNQYEQATNASLQPAFQQQQMQLQEQLAGRGISNTGAAGYLEGNLLGQQGATLSSAYAPLIQQGYGYSQADIAANQANQQSANQGNAGIANSAAGTNAASYNAAVGANYNAYNNYLNTLMGYGANEQNSLLSAYLNSFGANTGVTNAMSTGLSGVDSTYGNTYDAGLSGEYGAIDSAFGAAGTAAGAGKK